MTGAALNLARERGVRTTALTSSPAGDPVCRRLGFQPEGEFRVLTF